MRVQPENIAEPKQKYQKPVLVEYGPVAKLTQTGNGSGLDGGPAGMSMTCL